MMPVLLCLLAVLRLEKRENHQDDCDYLCRDFKHLPDCFICIVIFHIFYCGHIARLFCFFRKLSLFAPPPTAVGASVEASRGSDVTEETVLSLRGD